MEHPSVSIIIPSVQNCGEIEVTLGSLCRQTYNELEIVCLDCGDCEKYGYIIDQYSKTSNNVVIIHHSEE